MEFRGDLKKKTFLEGSVDHITYRDYKVNRRSFIYCRLACNTRVSGYQHVGRDRSYRSYQPVTSLSCVCVGRGVDFQSDL